MCLAAPAAVLSVDGDDALVDLDGVRLTVSRVLTPEVAAGDIVLVHVGFILSAIDPAQAAATLRDLKWASQEATP
jgi:hydrogenase expression/formation protein HypC